MSNFIDWISQPWPWYVAGPVIGLMVPLHLIFLNRTFGMSSSFRHMCAAVVPNNLDFLKYDWKSESWNLVMVAGVLIGAFIASAFLASDAPIALSESAILRLKGFGITISLDSTRLNSSAGHRSATGKASLYHRRRVPCRFRNTLCRRVHLGPCHHGHEPFSIALLVAVLGFFTGGLITSWILLPLSSLNL